jgi:hypothetical protein
MPGTEEILFRPANVTRLGSENPWSGPFGMDASFSVPSAGHGLLCFASGTPRRAFPFSVPLI